MNIKRNRMGRLWKFQLEGDDYAIASEKADKEIEVLREAERIEALIEFDRRSKKEEENDKQIYTVG